MANRPQIWYVVTDQRTGKVIQNAKVLVYETGTTTAPADLHAAPTGGAPIAGAFLTSNAQGEVKGYPTTPRNFALEVTDNNNACFFPATPGVTLDFPPFTEDPVPAYEDPVQEIIDVRTFGVVGDGVTDDTAGFLAAIAECETVTPRGARTFLIPNPAAGKFYKISGTLDFTNVWNTKVVCPSRYFFQQTYTDFNDDYALLHWFGAINTPMVKFHYSFGLIFENISVNARNVAGVIGFQLSEPATANSSVKFFTGLRVDAKYCDIGIQVGDVLNNGPDDAAVDFTDSYLVSNKSAGLRVASGNAVVRATGLFCSDNGTAPTGSHPGAQVHHAGGQLHLIDYTGSSTTSAVTGDIVTDTAAALRINGTWQENPGPALVAQSTNNGGCYVEGMRHYGAAMTAGNTPKSIIWSGPARLVTVGCRLFRSVELLAGQGGVWVDVGSNFDDAAATFIRGAGTSAILLGTTGGTFTGVFTLLPAAWTAYTPTLSAGWAVGASGTLAGAWYRIGNIVHWRAQIYFAGAGLSGSATPLTVSLPTAAKDAFTLSGAAVLQAQTAGTNHTLHFVQTSATTIAVYTPGTNGLLAAVTSTNPVTTAAQDILVLSGSYEAA